MKKLAIHRPGALGDVFCIIMLQDHITKKYGRFDLFVHQSIYDNIVELFNYNEAKFDLYPSDKLDRSKYEVMVDLVAYPVHLGYPETPMTQHLLRYIQEELGIAYMGWPKRLSLEAPPPPANLVSSSNYVTVQLKTGWSQYKELSLSQLESICGFIKQSYSYDIIQIGRADEPRLKNADAHMLGGKFVNALGAQAWAKYHIGPDSVFNHTTNIDWVHKYGPTKAMIYFGSTSAIGSGYSNNLNVTMNLHCSPCYRENPEISKQSGGPCPYGGMCLKSIPDTYLQSYVIKLFEA